MKSPSEVDDLIEALYARWAYDFGPDQHQELVTKDAFKAGFEAAMKVVKGTV
jgi:hypothetical protein